MKKRLVSAGVAACTVIMLCACSPEEEEDIFTGDVAERLPYQDNLDLISPAAYSEIDGLDLDDKPSLQEAFQYRAALDVVLSIAKKALIQKLSIEGGLQDAT